MELNGIELRKWRKAMGFTLSELAKEAKITPARLCVIEQDGFGKRCEALPERLNTLTGILADLAIQRFQKIDEFLRAFE